MVENICSANSMLMKFKEKASSNRRAVLFLRYLNNGRYFPLLRVYDAGNNVIFEKDLPEEPTFDNYGQISMSSKKVTIKPRKNSWSDCKPIEFVL